MGRVASVTDFIYIEDIDMVFDHLEKKYGYSKQWRFDCHQFMGKRSELTPALHPVLYFLQFCIQRVEPLLNAVLCNPYGYSYFMRMVCWLVRDRLQGVGWIKFEEGETF